MSTTLPMAAPPPAPTSCCRHCDQHRAALSTDLSAPAYALYSAVLLRLGTSSTTSCSDVADAAGVTPHQARPLLAELVRVGLVARERRISRRTTVTSFRTLWKDPR
ncbi:FaeA/PapI family transcriptional regulator [Kitasatospora sp. NPDC088548]|uniref:FaeA/PapI family transcriptional regulator n=1 Tax=Kitasatospora sp. NPDC088548 TaxID=3364075 RepID=UPI003818CA72